MWNWIKNIAGGIGSAVAGWFGYKESKERNIAQQAAAREQMDFQERMAATAHQREVADLKAAGLNPILSAKYGGAATPPGAMPSVISNIEGVMSGISSAKSFADINLTRNLAKTEATKRAVNARTMDVLERQAKKIGKEIDMLGEYSKIAGYERAERRLRHKIRTQSGFRNFFMPVGEALREMNPFMPRLRKIMEKGK